MAYMVSVVARVSWVPDGTGGVTLGQMQSDIAGYGSGSAAGPVGSGQTMQFLQGEIVAGGDALTGSNLSAALSSAATDLYNHITAAQLAQMQGWKTGTD